MEILLYGDIYTHSSAFFISQMEEAASESKINVRINTNGGDPMAVFGMMAKYTEFEGEKTCSVDGEANSSGLFFICASDHTSALVSSRFLIHRGAYSSYMESSEYFDDKAKKELNDVNAHLRRALEARINVPKFEKMKGVTMDEIFSLEERVEVMLNAKEAKSIGLIEEIKPLTNITKRKYEANCTKFRMAAFYDNKASKEIEVEEVERKPINVNSSTKPQTTKTNNKMDYSKLTVAEILANRPELITEVENKAVTAERKRVKGWMIGADINDDATRKVVAEGISGSEDVTPEILADFGEARFKIKAKAGLDDGNADDITADADKGNGNETKDVDMKSIEAKIDADLGLK